MKKQTMGLIICLALLILLFGLSGCTTTNPEISESTESLPSQSISPPESPEVIEAEQTPDLSLEGKTISEDGVLGNWTVTIAGAQKSEFSDGKKALIVFYDFTNNSAESISPFLALDVSTYQLGEKLKTVHAFDELPYQGNSSLSVRPGASIRCSAIYEYNEGNGNVSVHIRDWTGDASIVVYKNYDPKNLPGEIGTYEVAPVESVNITDSLPHEAEMDKCKVSIHNEASKTTDWDDFECIRVSIDFSNNGESNKNFSEDFTTTAFQDGIELQKGFASDSLPEDQNSWADIQPGSTVTLSLVYKIRSHSPVEIEISAADGTKIGMKYAVEQVEQ